jgi:hypothetical protein
MAGRWLTLGLAFVLTAAMAGCAAKKPIWGDPATGLVLTYRMTEAQPLEYRQALNHTQDMEVMGQTMQVQTDKTTRFSMAPKGVTDENHQVTVTIEEVEISLTSAQGSISPDLAGLSGRSFDMTLSILGKELDLEGAKEIEFEMGPAGKRNVHSDFQAFFPDLAGRPVTVGDTWATEDEITESSDEGEVVIKLQGVNTLEGLEVVDGVDCARVTTTLTGTASGKGSQQGMEFTIEGELEGSSTWYFAYKEGYFFKELAEITSKGSVKMSGPQEMTIPVTQRFKVETSLVRGE